MEGFFTTKTDRALLDRFDPRQAPTHVAVIMDGNGRWAAKRTLPRLFGHRAGAKAVRESIAACLELGIRYLTIYSFSSENWRRSDDEVSDLMSLFVEVLEAEMVNLMDKRVRVMLIGSEAGVPETTLRAFRRAEEKTAGNDRLTLVVALNYGGRLEITDAVRHIAREVAQGAQDPRTITEETVAQHLYTSTLPDPDLVIRTSGEMRISNFLLWQIAYSELWVTSTLWPDFKRGDLLKAVVDYQGRTRRFGGRS
ncbi:MAG TPA: isoprenyl transferase [Actinobacteria bacterium]|nr:isoprenyl transferase [Actinomycetota bacterium]